MYRKMRELARAVEARRVEHAVGQFADEVAHQERAETGLEPGVEQDQRPARVVEAERDDQVADGNHQHLERDEVAGDEDREQEPVAGKAVLREREAGHR